MSDTQEEFPTIKGYKIERKLGEGGMAHVYLALQEGFERHVALKVLAPHLAKDEDFKMRFVREAKMAAQMSHQSIVPIYDFGISGDYHFMAMEYLPHGDLKQRMIGGIPLQEAISITKTIANGLDYAGKKGLVHRDIKPENILFREDNSPVISDFGIARQVSAATNITIIGSAVGTPRYMSPEQAQGNMVDARSDLYSLGVIFYELLTGRAPFISDSAISVSIKHITEMAPPLPPQYASLQSIVDLAMEKNPDNRFQTGNDFVRALTIAEDRLSTASAKTVILSNSQAILAATQHSRASLSTPNTAAQQTQTSQTSASTPQTAPLYKKPLFWGLCFVFSQVVLAGSWFLLQSGNPESDAPDISTLTTEAPLKNTTQNHDRKINDLLVNANNAFDSGRYFEPHNNSAQYFLTTLLTLAPEHTQGSKKITELYTHYLESAQQAITVSALDKAEKNLNQASQISYYIDNTAAKERFKALYQAMIQQRQQYIVASQSSETVKQLLKQAENALINGHYTSPPGDNALEYYRKILIATPDNAMAKDGIIRTTGALLAKAEEHVRLHQFTKAKAYAAEAEQIAPEHPEINKTYALISDEHAKYQRELLQQNIEQNLIAEKKQLDQLLGKANTALKQLRLTRPENDNALHYFKKVLALSPAHPEAQNGIDTIDKYYVSKFKNALQNNAFTKAESLITTYATLAKQNDVQDLRNLLNQRKAEAEKPEPSINTAGKSKKGSTRISELMAEAKQLTKRKPTEKNNSALRDRYLAILDINPSNTKAKEGLRKTTRFEVKLAETAMTEYRLSDAQNHINIISATDSNFELTPLRGRLLESKKSQAKAAGLLQQASALIQQPYIKPGWLENNREPRERLTRAYSLITNARKLTGESPDVTNMLNQLDEKYASIVSTLLTDDDQPSADTFINDTRNYEWSGFKLALVSSKTLTATQLKTQKDEQAVQKALSKLLSDATRLIEKTYIPPGLLENNNESRDELIEAYNLLDNARKLNADDPRIHTLFEKLDAKYAKVVTLLINEGDEKEAQKFIGDTRRFDWTGSKTVLASLSHSGSSTDNKESSLKLTITKLLDEARSLIDHPYFLPGLLETNNDARTRLTDAYNKIDSALRLEPDNSRALALLIKLEDKYTHIVQVLLKNEDEDEAKSFIKDTRNFKWQAPKLAAIKIP